MQWNDSINNEGHYLSLTKTCILERIKTLGGRGEDSHESSPAQIFTKLPGTHKDTPSLTDPHITY